MAQILDYKATEPLRRFNRAKSFTIPFSPRRVRLASIRLRLPKRANRVQLIASVGVRGITGIAQILFKIFRDGTEIFNTKQGIESAGSEQNYIVTFQAIDFNVESGSHTYTVTAENTTAGTRADVVGPISFSGLAIKTTK
ncbi:exosporium protein C [Paenibacillus profundus]|uniref:Exosporium protein C n=1 Tax=Paenibacillus profundus TaxID=1173085 RepID=A0ABS8YMP9_9BACL|nr:exosporium protein C [Paenibacillus profundus]MCE5170874.1 exosporium protein C [Paenibacillus profundus]